MPQGAGGGFLVWQASSEKQRWGAAADAASEGEALLARLRAELEEKERLYREVSPISLYDLPI